MYRRALWMGLLLGAVPVVLDLISLLPGSGALSPVSSIVAPLVFLGQALAILAAMLALPFAFFRRGRPAAPAVLLTVVVFLAGSIVGGLGVRELRGLAIDAIPTDYDRLVAAIERFEIERGHAPHQLSELVPAYIRKIPGRSRGVVAEMHFTQMDSIGVIRRILTYDLGVPPAHWRSMAPRSSARAPVRATLRIGLSLGDTVLATHVSGAPMEIPSAQFDSRIWRTRVVSRGEMARSAAAAVQGLTRSDVDSLLGPPSEARPRSKTRWELSLRLNGAFPDKRILVFTPEGLNPEASFRSFRIRRVGRWTLHSNDD